MSENPSSIDQFPKRLREARKLRQLEQAELAEKAGLPVTSISHFETGTRKPSFDNLKRLAQSLAVSSDFLLGQVDSPNLSKDSDPLYRHVQKLTGNDRDIAADFLEMLATRGSKNEKQKR